MVHEMGHVLCFGHEQNRNDKAGWIYDCSTEKYEHLNFGHLYDYMSIMQYGCWSCIAPTREGVSLDQCESRDGLSILDAEKINDMLPILPFQVLPYAKRHHKRGPWRVRTLRRAVCLYVCRAFVKGEIVSGKCVVRGGVWSCWVPHGGSEYGVHNQEEFEGLTNPANVNLRWVAGGGGAIPGNAIASGRTANGEPV
ncbi:Embryonic protein UVS.2 [Folsomia candida]|uniref:Embryonic protein UVS.2 n=1 Tax=Folsomia candida TaxID=158441 RepID=A0A226D6X4_FOLCA|nr:Embryonic protein UVS.2 [Folsomia candida]